MGDPTPLPLREHHCYRVVADVQDPKGDAPVWEFEFYTAAPDAKRATYSYRDKCEEMNVRPLDRPRVYKVREGELDPDGLPRM